MARYAFKALCLLLLQLGSIGGRFGKVWHGPGFGDVRSGAEIVPQRDTGLVACLDQRQKCVAAIATDNAAGDVEHVGVKTHRHIELEPGAGDDATAGGSGEGAGKTTTLAKVFSTYATSFPPGSVPCNILSLRTPSPSILKSAGFEIVKKPGLPMQKVPTEATIWSMVRSMLKAHQFAVLHLDEAQDINGRNRGGDINAVVNTMKSLMQQEDWPIVLVLSGTGEVRTPINAAPQLARLLSSIMFDRLTMTNDRHDVAGTMENSAKLAGLKLADALHTEYFIARLIHAAAHEMDVLIESIIGAIEDALTKNKSISSRTISPKSLPVVVTIRPT